MNFGGVALEPFVGTSYFDVRGADFAERGGAAALQGSSGGLQATFSTLGVHATSQLDDGTHLRGMLGWRHAFGDKAPAVSESFQDGQPFTISGAPVARNVAMLEVAIDKELLRNLTVAVSYAGQFGSHLGDQGIRASLNWKF